MYTTTLCFSWDEEKSGANLRERGFDFGFASLIFSGPTLEREDCRRDYGERRIIAIGVADGIHVALVYMDRSIGRGVVERRIISARRANRKERVVYEAYQQDQDPQSWPRRPRSRAKNE
jgi:uncharacterized protein